LKGKRPRKLPEPRPCDHCGEVFQPGPFCERQILCPKPACQQEKLYRTKTCLKKAKERANGNGNGNEPRIYKKRGVEVTQYRCRYVDTKGRRCRVWSVNRFNCPSHQSLLSRMVATDQIYPEKILEERLVLI